MTLHMHIESIAVQNYKSFLERQSFQFETGFNLLVGANTRARPQCSMFWTMPCERLRRGDSKA